MKRVIYKYELKVRDTDILLPRGSVFRHVGCQGEKLFVWIEQYVQEQELTEDCFRNITFKIQGTGWEFADSSKDHFIGSAITESGFVWHIFQEKE
jgi:hypothetical protein